MHPDMAASFPGHELRRFTGTCKPSHKNSASSAASPAGFERGAGGYSLLEGVVLSRERDLYV